MSRFFLPHVARMSGYQPGEQPRGGAFVKLNTNENPYPPSPRVAEAITAALGDRLRRYPDPLGTAFRETAARHHGVSPDMVLPGNGSDDLLTILTRAFAGAGRLVVAPTPSYILYRTLAEFQDARLVEVPFRPTGRSTRQAFADPGARLTFLANPNSPSGTCLTPDEVAAIAGRLDGPLVVDEAYADFAETDCVGLIRDHPNVIVTRSFSKGYSLAGLRLGYLVAGPRSSRGWSRSRIRTTATPSASPAARRPWRTWTISRLNRSKILATRRRLTGAVRALGFAATESQANFVWCPGHPPAVEIYQALKARKILVRLMRYPGRAARPAGHGGDGRGN